MEIKSLNKRENFTPEVTITWNYSELRDIANAMFAEYDRGNLSPEGSKTYIQIQMLFSLLKNGYFTNDAVITAASRFEKIYPKKEGE